MGPPMQVDVASVLCVVWLTTLLTKNFDSPPTLNSAPAAQIPVNGHLEMAVANRFGAIQHAAAERTSRSTPMQVIVETGMHIGCSNALNIKLQSEVPSKSKFLVKQVDRKQNFLNISLDRKLPGRWGPRCK